jgi:DNA-binding CsgD family transcriptional regulator
MLLERGAELDGLRDALGRARGRAGTIVLVSGEAGIGKTSLVRAFTAEVSGTARVLAGACKDLLAPRTLGPFRDMVQAGALPAPVPSGRSERDDYLDLLLGELSFALRPAVVVDDAHWADDASLDILRYLGRRVERLPALLVVTYRPGELRAGTRCGGCWARSTVPRQLTVLGLIAEGLTSQEIAARLVLSRRTVDNHVTALVSRLGVAGRREVVAIAVARGWIPAPRGARVPAGQAGSAGAGGGNRLPPADQETR